MPEMNNQKRIIVFHSSASDKRVCRLKEETEKMNLEFESFNLHRDVPMTQDGLYKIAGHLPIVLDKNTLCWILSNSNLSHYFEKLYSKSTYFTWPTQSSIDFSDKMFANHFLARARVKTPKTILVSCEKTLLDGIRYVGGFPCVIKKTFGSGGAEVELVGSIESLKKFIRNIYQNKADKELVPFLRSSFILQEYIESARGSDYRVLCLDGELLGGIKRNSQNGDFRANLYLGGKAEPFAIDQKLEKACQAIIQKGKLFYAGLDFIKNGDQYLAIEINTSAQFQGFEEATGINVAKKIIEALVKK
ncbi:MAG: RimK family alpha-L-glutamate ligase [Candidatus Pacebacteria bacterium]|nr:RimK family alpha-L-glutamate ligase [Candidatus Paceibacterota bacterium]MDR3583264.1 RimK family alpha-L-glutamate ligase [Candidatus Paceibacterota bacterium]